MTKKYKFSDIEANASKNSVIEDSTDTDTVIDLLLRHYLIPLQYTNDLIELNKRNVGSDDERLPRWITPLEEHYDYATILKFIHDTHTANGKSWLQPSNLTARGDLDSNYFDMEAQYPKVEICRIIRVQDRQKNEFVHRMIKVTGLSNKDGRPKHIHSEHIDWWVRPRVQWLTVPKNSNDSKTDPHIERVRVASLAYDHYGTGEAGGDTIYITPWNSDIVKNEWYKQAIGPFNVMTNGCNLGIHRYSDNLSVSVPDPDTFLLPWDEMISRLEGDSKTTIAEAVSSRLRGR